MEALAVIIYLAILGVFIFAWVMVLSKAGYSGWWVLLAFVPLVNIAMFLVFAFSNWPALQRPPPQVPAYGTPPVPPPPTGGAWT